MYVNSWKLPCDMRVVVLDKVGLSLLKKKCYMRIAYVCLSYH